MKTIHPFPARMAPDLIGSLLSELPGDAVVLDPMCGSGVVIHHALRSKRRAVGFDVDPLAVRISRAWCSRGDQRGLLQAAEQLVERASSLKLSDVVLPWMDRCPETSEFVAYWFASIQKRQLRKLAFSLMDNSQLTNVQRDILWTALSRTIITKHVGATLAWDVSHSRPHKMRDENDYDVFSNFLSSVQKLVGTITDEPLSRAGKVRMGDCRSLDTVPGHSIDAIITSPPYLNAIDYLRGHKFSLIWMGYSLPQLRAIRSGSIGTEVGGADIDVGPVSLALVKKILPNSARLPIRQQKILRKYAVDAHLFLTEMRRVIRHNGSMSLVLGDCNIKGEFIQNSKLFAHLAKKAGFTKSKEVQRQLEERKRYLPSTSNNNSLEKRMRYEVVQTYFAT